MSHVTRILERIEQGEGKAAEELLPLVYEELRKLAAHKMAQEPPGQTLQPTALVHEAWLRLGGDHQPAWQNRAHFLAAAAEAMRRILVESARRKLRVKRAAKAFQLGLCCRPVPFRYHRPARVVGDRGGFARSVKLATHLHQHIGRHYQFQRSAGLRYFTSLLPGASAIGCPEPRRLKFLYALLKTCYS